MAKEEEQKTEENSSLAAFLKSLSNWFIFITRKFRLLHVVRLSPCLHKRLMKNDQWLVSEKGINREWVETSCGNRPVLLIDVSLTQNKSRFHVWESKKYRDLFFLKLVRQTRDWTNIWNPRIFWWGTRVYGWTSFPKRRVQHVEPSFGFLKVWHFLSFCSIFVYLFVV